MYDQLSRGGVPYGGNYPNGTAVVTPEGFVGIRGANAPNPAVDVNFPSIPQVTKLHF